jgi:hypothetical protein
LTSSNAKGFAVQQIIVITVDVLIAAILAGIVTGRVMMGNAASFDCTKASGLIDRMSCHRKATEPGAGHAKMALERMKKANGS